MFCFSFAYFCFPHIYAYALLMENVQQLFFTFYFVSNSSVLVDTHLVTQTLVRNCVRISIYILYIRYFCLYIETKLTYSHSLYI